MPPYQGEIREMPPYQGEMRKEIGSSFLPRNDTSIPVIANDSEAILVRADCFVAKSLPAMTVFYPISYHP